MVGAIRRRAIRRVGWFTGDPVRACSDSPFDVLTVRIHVQK